MTYPIIPDSAEIVFDDLSLVDADGWATTADIDGTFQIDRDGNVIAIAVRQHRFASMPFRKETRDQPVPNGALFDLLAASLAVQYADAIRDRMDEMDVLDPDCRVDPDTAPIRI